MENTVWRNGLWVSWTARVVTLFKQGEGRLPKDLAEVFAHRLPTGRSSDPTTDLFGHPMQYVLAENGESFTLTSLGKDGRRGGRGPDADVKVEEP